MISFPFVVFQMSLVPIFLFMLPYKVDSFKIRPPLVNAVVITIIAVVYVHFNVSAQMFSPELPFRLSFSDSGYFGNLLSLKNVAEPVFAADTYQLVKNIFFLYIFGNMVAADISNKFYLAVFLFATLIVAGFDAGQTVVSLGISGFAYALAGACAVLFPVRLVTFSYSIIILNGTFKIPLFWLILLLVLGDVFSLLNNLLGRNFSNIYYLGHLIGFIVGAMVAYVSLKARLIKSRSCDVRLLPFVNKKFPVFLASKLNPDNQYIVFTVLFFILIKATMNSIEYSIIFIQDNPFPNAAWNFYVIFFWNLLIEPLFVVMLLVIAAYRKINTLLIFSVLILTKITINLLTHRVLEFELVTIILVLFILQAARSSDAWPGLQHYINPIRSRVLKEKAE